MDDCYEVACDFVVTFLSAILIFGYYLKKKKSLSHCDVYLLSDYIMPEYRIFIIYYNVRHVYK